MDVVNQNNEAYVENFLPKASLTEKKKMVSILNQYGENRWWLSNDHKTIVENQIKQPFLLIELNKFLRALEKVLERHVKLDELDNGKPYETLKKEVINKLHK
jgi:hypothetical protein